MSELRKDYFLDEWVIINEKRNTRPHQIINQKKVKPSKDFVDFFAPGNEKFTPAETYRVGTKDKWDMRVFPNKFAIIDTSKETKKHPYGYHEVIAETPTEKQLWDLPIKTIETLLKVYNQRIVELSKKKKIKYVHVFKNHGKKAGTSILHSHSQVMALSYTPPKLVTLEKAYIKNKKSKFLNIIPKEKKSKRLCAENKTMIAFCPYASQFNYETIIIPKKHIKSLNDFTEENYQDMAALLKKILVKLKKLNIDFNYYINYAAKNSNMHMHIRVTPRKQLWAGFEVGTGVIVNNVSPETAAKYYRGK